MSNLSCNDRHNEKDDAIMEIILIERNKNYTAEQISYNLVDSGIYMNSREVSMFIRAYMSRRISITRNGGYNRFNLKQVT